MYIYMHAVKGILSNAAAAEPAHSDEYHILHALATLTNLIYHS